MTRSGKNDTQKQMLKRLPLNYARKQLLYLFILLLIPLFFHYETSALLKTEVIETEGVDFPLHPQFNNPLNVDKIRTAFAEELKEILHDQIFGMKPSELMNMALRIEDMTEDQKQFIGELWDRLAINEMQNPGVLLAENDGDIIDLELLLQLYGEDTPETRELYLLNVRIGLQLRFGIGNEFDGE